MIEASGPCLSVQDARKLIPETENVRFSDAEVEQLVATMAFLADLCLEAAAADAEPLRRTG